jgi:hypothetical protein
MSGLTPKADMCSATRRVRFTPKSGLYIGSPATLTFRHLALAALRAIALRSLGIQFERPSSIHKTRELRSLWKSRSLLLLCDEHFGSIAQGSLTVF